MAFPASPLDIEVDLEVGTSVMRCGAAAGQATVFSGGDCWAYDKSLLDVTGDIDVRIDIAAEDWTPPNPQVLVAKNFGFGIFSNNFAWQFVLESNGTVQFSWSPDGTFGSSKAATSTVAIGATDGTRKCIRATLDVDNGASGWTCTFYTANDIDSTFTQLGAAVTTAGVTSIANTTAELEIGSINNGDSGQGTVNNFIGRVYALTILNGIGGGSFIVNPRFTEQPPGTTSFTDINGTTFYLTGSHVIVRDWVDITTDVNQRGKISITRGQQNESATSSAGSCSFEIDNRTGNYSPRNPNSTYYGALGRATQARVGIGGPIKYAWFPRAQNDYTFCTDTAGISVTGDIQVMIDVDLDAWDFPTLLAAKTFEGGGSRSWALVLDSQGRLEWNWSADGSTWVHTVLSDPVPRPWYGRKTIVVTLDVNNGSGGNTTIFYTSDTISGGWTQLGAAQVFSGTTSIFDSKSEIVLMGFDANFPGACYRKLYAFQLHNGILGSTVANPDFTLATAGARSIVDGAGNKWFLTGLSEISDQDWRWAGEISEWPVNWDNTGKDIYSKVTGGSWLRKLGQGASALHSTMYYGMTRRSQVKAYWPCEDNKGSTQFASGLPGKPAMSVYVGATSQVQFDSDTGFVCSEGLPQIKNTGWVGSVVDYDNSQNTEFNVWALVHIPTNPAAEVGLFRVWTAGGSAAVLWQLTVDGSGNLRLLAVNAGLGIAVDSGLQSFAFNQKYQRISMELRQNGANIDWAFLTYEIGAPFGFFWNGTLAGATLGKPTKVETCWDAGLDDASMGHISVNSPILGLFALQNEQNAYEGETAGFRFIRLCNQEGVPWQLVGTMNQSTSMGPQLPKTLLELLRECEATDQGEMYDPRAFSGVGFRTKAGIYRQSDFGGPVLSLDYNSAHLSAISPTDDDQNTRNDVTAKNPSGSSARQTLDDNSPLSIGQIGRIDTEVSVNTANDSVLGDIANWALHLGTVNQARYPSISLELARNPFVSSSSLTNAVRALDVGDKLTITNPPSFMPPEAIEQIAIGFTEVLWNFTHTFTINCRPEEPFHVGIYSNANSRYGSLGTLLVNPVTTSATSFSVFTRVGPSWSTSDGAFDIMVMGERMTVNSITGSGAQQTFNVTRSVNGVVKAHLPNETVELAVKSYYAQ